MIGSYRRGEQIGTGTYARVYEGWDEQNRPVALKEQLANNGAYLRESAVVMSVRHPHILACREILFVDNLVIHVLTRCQGTLTSLRREALAVKLRLLAHVLSGLEFLHRYHLIHGDLKPDNVLITSDDRAVLADFGLSVRDYGQSLPRTIQSLWWRAPEVLAGHRYGTAIDMWSFGIILYWAVTGRHLLTETDPIRLQTQQRRLDLKVEDSNLQTILDGCLQLDPRQRWTASQALQALGCSSSQGQWFSTVGFLPTSSLRHKDSILQALAQQIHRRCGLHPIGCLEIASTLLYGHEITQTSAVQEICLATNCAFY